MQAPFEALRLLVVHIDADKVPGFLINMSQLECHRMKPEGGGL